MVVGILTSNVWHVWSIAFASTTVAVQWWAYFWRISTKPARMVANIASIVPSSCAPSVNPICTWVFVKNDNREQKNALHRNNHSHREHAFVISARCTTRSAFRAWRVVVLWMENTRYWNALLIVTTMDVCTVRYDKRNWTYFKYLWHWYFHIFFSQSGATWIWMANYLASAMNYQFVKSATNGTSTNDRVTDDCTIIAWYEFDCYNGIHSK